MALLNIAKKYGLSLDELSRQYSGCIEGEEQYTRFLDDLKSIGVTFATFSTHVGRVGRLVFQVKNCDTPHTAYSGMPFEVVKTTYMLCSLGGSYRQFSKHSSLDNQPSTTKKRSSVKPSKKINCPAKMVVRCWRVYSEDCYRAKAPTYKPGSREMREITKQLKKDLQTSSPPTGLLRFIINMSPEEEHSHTTVSTKLSSIIHPRLREEIRNYVENNMCSTKTMKIHLEEFVQRMFEDGDRPKPDKLNRCYYPKDKVIRLHMYKALYKVKQDKYDQVALGPCITTWQNEFPDDKFLFRPYNVQNSDVEEESYCSTFLFCHQSKWQQDLLARYGNNISLLDPAYKTTKYDIPLFFIVVKTNSGYCIAGTFVVQSESNALIAEALSQFKEWNPDWDPKYFMTDNSEAGISALEETFPESTVYLCAFHVEQSWRRWLMKTGNVSRRAIAPLTKLWRDIAASPTDQDYVQNLKKMYDNKLYQESPNAQRYFSEEWLPVNYRWVTLFHINDFLSQVNINNGVEGQTKILNHTYLKNTKYSTLTSLIKTVITFLLPDMLHNYCTFNAVADCEYNETLPEFLKNRPMSFIDHVIERLESGKEFDSSHINYVGEGEFLVQSELDSNDWFKVDFQEGTCKCFDFCKWRFPCKHMCAVFMYTEWGFDSLPLLYRENPFIMVDTNYTAIIGVASNYVVESYFVDNESCDDAHLTSTVTHDDDCEPHSVGSTHIAITQPPTTCTTIDEKKSRLELQRNLRVIMEYASMQFTHTNLENVVELSRQMMEAMRSLVTKSEEGLLLGPSEENTSVITHFQEVNNIKKTYINLPKRTKTNSKHKNSSKCVPQHRLEFDKEVEVDFMSTEFM